LILDGLSRSRYNDLAGQFDTVTTHGLWQYAPQPQNDRVVTIYERLVPPRVTHCRFAVELNRPARDLDPVPLPPITAKHDANVIGE
jgi:hypothetical protein